MHRLNLVSPDLHDIVPGPQKTKPPETICETNRLSW